MIIHNAIPYTSSRIDILASNLIKQTGTGDKDYLFIEPYSIGDTFHTLSLMNNFRRKYCTEGQKINFICNPRCLGVAKIFRNVNKASGLDCGPIEFQLESFAHRYETINTGVPLVTCPDMYSRGFLGRLIQENIISGITARKLVMDLDLSDQPELPELDPHLMSRINARAADIGLVPGSIIIFNHANSVRSVPEEWLTPIRASWPGNIYYDASLGEKGSISWATPLKMTIEEIPYFAKIAGSVFAVRSGIVDVLSVSGAKIVSLYPNSDLLYDWMGDRRKIAESFRSWTLDSCEIGYRSLEFPIFLDEEDTEEEMREKISMAVSMLIHDRSN